MPVFRIKRSKSNENSIADIIELLASAWAVAANISKGRRILESATPGQQLLLGYYLYRDDVTNGGHLQYFGNYTGNLWQEALKATRVLHLAEERILRNAVSLFPDNQPGFTQRDRRKQLASIDPAKFDDLDNRFHDAQGSDKKIEEYIENHADEFYMLKRCKSK